MMRNAYKPLVGKSEGKRPHRCKDSIRVNLKELGWGNGLDSFDSEWGAMAGSCECSNEPSGSMKAREFLDLLSSCWLLKKDSAL